MIRAVIFDMFETLITHYQSPLYFGAQMAEDAGISESQFQMLWRPTEDDRSTGKVTLEEVLEMILRKTQSYSEETMQKIVSKRVEAKEECFRHLHEEIIPMLTKLREEGILVGLISNCFSEEAEVIRRSILCPYFDALYMSYEQGVQKPDKEIYIRCMNELGVKPEDCLYVGDGGSHELEAAKELGMQPLQACWYLQEGTLQPTGRKKDFLQLDNPMDVLKYIGR